MQTQTAPGTPSAPIPTAPISTGSSRAVRARSGAARARSEDETPQPHTLTPKAVAGIVVLGLACFFAITTELMPVGLLGTMSASLHVSTSQMGVVVTVYALAVAILALPLTVLTTRFPRKTVLIATLAGYTVSNLLVALAPSFAVVCAGRIIGGVAHALFFSVASAYATRMVPPRLAGRAIAFVYSGTSLGFVVGVPIATTVGEHIGWRVAIGGVAAATALLALVALAFLPSVRGESHPHLGSVKSWSRSGLLAVATADLLLFAGHYIVYTFIGPYLEGAGLAADSIGSALLVLGGTGVIGLLVAGTFVDRAPRQTLLAAVGVMALALAALPFVHDTLTGTFVVAGLWMAANGTTGTLFMAAAIRSGGVSPDIAGALINAASNVGIAGGAALGSAAYGVTGLSALPFAAAVVLAVSFGVVVMARRGFPAHGHSQPTLTTSSIQTVTASMRTITTSIQTITSSIRTVHPRTGSVATATGSIRTSR